MLGPVRFTHIENCAREVCKVFKVEDEMQDCVSMLQSLDDILADLRGELANLKGESSPQTRDAKSEARLHPTKGYSALRKSMDVTKARRQISAREKAIESVKKLINQQREEPSSPHASGPGFIGSSRLVADSCFSSFITCLPLVTLPVLEAALAPLYRESQCNDGITTIMAHISEEPFQTFWAEIETTREDERCFVKLALSGCY
jgi:hypothetical protein